MRADWRPPMNVSAWREWEVQGFFSDEQHLMHELVGHYENSVRPVYNASDPVDVRLGLTLTQILDLDEKNQVLTTNVWLEAEWFDERLRWNSSDFGSITSIRIPCDRIWLPDIVLYNSVDDYTSGYMPSLAMVYNTSRVFWGPVIRFRSSCKIDITYFPFDDQVCRLKLGSWAYNGFQVNVWNRSDTMDLSNFVDNGEWELIGVKVRRNVVYYNCCDEPFPDVTFFVHLRRRIKYYFMNIIIPCSILSFLCLAGFLLPPESGEKITLGLSVLLTITVFMLMVADKMPQTSESISVISIYLMVVLATSCLSVLSSVLVLSIHHQRGKPHRVPHWLRFVVFGVVAKVICVKTHTQYHPARSGSGRGKGFHGLSSGRHKERKTPRSPRRGRVATKESEFLKMEYTSKGSGGGGGGGTDSPNVYPCTPPSEPLLPRSLRPPAFATPPGGGGGGRSRRGDPGAGKAGHHHQQQHQHFQTWRPATGAESPIKGMRRNRSEKLGQGEGFQGEGQGHDEKLLLCTDGGEDDGNDNDVVVRSDRFEEQELRRVHGGEGSDDSDNVRVKGLKQGGEEDGSGRLSRRSPGGFVFESAAASGSLNVSAGCHYNPEGEAGIEDGGGGGGGGGGGRRSIPGEDGGQSVGLAHTTITTTPITASAGRSDVGSPGECHHNDDVAGRTLGCFLCGRSSYHRHDRHVYGDGDVARAGDGCDGGIITTTTTSTAADAGANGTARTTFDHVVHHNVAEDAARPVYHHDGESARRNIRSPYRSEEEEEQSAFCITLSDAPYSQDPVPCDDDGNGGVGVEAHHQHQHHHHGSRHRRHVTPALSADNSPRRRNAVKTSSSSRRSVSDVTYRSGEETTFCVRREVAVPLPCYGVAGDEALADTSLCSSYREASSPEGTPCGRRDDDDSRSRGARQGGRRGENDGAAGREEYGSDYSPPPGKPSDVWGGEENGALESGGDSCSSSAAAAAAVNRTNTTTTTITQSPRHTNNSSSNNNSSSTAAANNNNTTTTSDHNHDHSQESDRSWHASQGDIASKFCNNSSHHHFHHHHNSHQHNDDDNHHHHPGYDWNQRSGETAGTTTRDDNGRPTTTRDASPASGRPCNKDGTGKNAGKARDTHAATTHGVSSTPTRREYSRRSSSRAHATGEGGGGGGGGSGGGGGGGGGGLGDAAVIQRLISLIESKHRDEVKDEAVYREWHDVACVLDRLLFYVFLVITVVSSITILMMRPGHVEF